MGPMPADPLTKTAARWRREAETLRGYGADKLAEAAERHAQELEDAWEAYRREELTVDQAAAESGYSPTHIRDLVRRGKIPDLRDEGSQGRIRVRREHLPRKPGPGDAGDHEGDPDVRDLFERVR